MPLISVKAKPGRIAYDAPRGTLIPTDRYVLVDKTNWVSRLLEVHADIELEPVAKPVVFTQKTEAATK